MSFTVLLALGACCLVGLIAGAYYAMLAFHNPYKPKWMENGWVNDVVTILLVSAGTLVFGLVLRGLVAAGVDPLVAMIIEFTFILGTAVILWHKLHVMEGLDAARNGVSPFDELRSIRYHQRHRFDRPGAGSGAAGTA